MKSMNCLVIGVMLLFIPQLLPAQQDSMVLNNDAFTIAVKKYGISGIWKTNDVHPTNYIRRNRLLGEVLVRYRTEGGSLDSVNTQSGDGTIVLQNGKKVYTYKAGDSKGVLQLSQSFELKANILTWKIRLKNTGTKPVVIEDLALPFFYNNQGGEDPKQIFERQVVKHNFISGNGSFIFFQRPTGVAPYLVIVPNAGTPLEYFSMDRYDNMPSVFQAYIHSAYTGNKETRGTWRQPHTSYTLPANGSITYGFNLQWAKDYKAVRDILMNEGSIDIHVAPGMTVPNDLEAMFALRTKAPVNKIIPEFPQHTVITYLGEKQKGTHLYKVRFAKLGENMLTVHYNGKYRTFLEFFVTEPLEVLYKKRAAFLVNRQQFRDTTKWYDGVYGPWDMKNTVLRSYDNREGEFPGRLEYVLTCDDPGLCKAPFLAAKNVFYPDMQEIESIEYYIKHFVWGKLQRTDKEAPFPYGVYGTPNWFVNRNSQRRQQNVSDTNRFRMHVWRSYDYPHIMMLYYHMYQIATMYPDKVSFTDKNGYLKLAMETAKAYFKYPYEILPWYETYKWGCYNELLLVDLMEDLEREGYKDDAEWLRKEWEKKVKYFIYDDPYPFRSEYAVDATAFESSQALAAYGVLNDMEPDTNLWYDKNANKWHSHPVVSKDSARNFMDRQIHANIALRGWLEPTYYFYGSDFRGRSDFYTLSYMSQMGGWAILDYGLNFSNDPADYLRLGYASYLSSFALMNTGPRESNYGYWYPGEENDGASGWAFEPRKFTRNWVMKEQGRGPWIYDGEIDLGYGGATRAAATIVANDPVFGPIAYGGVMSKRNDLLYITPKDGLRTKLFYRLNNSKIDIKFNRDGFAKDLPVVFSSNASSLAFTIENRTNDAHDTEITISGLKKGVYQLSVSGKHVKRVQFNGEPEQVKINLNGDPLHEVKLQKV